MRARRVLGWLTLMGASMVVLRAWHRRQRPTPLPDRWHERDIVDITLEQSFPASDPPFWTNTTSG